MAKKSSNTQGNPYHDEATGEFTSPNGGGNVDNKPKLKLKVKTNIDIQAEINDLNQCANVPILNTASEIEEHITEFFSKTVIDKIDSLYGKTGDCASFQFHPKSNPNMILEIFPNVLGKYRYKDNHAHIVNGAEFKKLEESGNYTNIYRGISSRGEKAKNIVGNYGTVDLNNFDYYCPNGGNCFGSNIYTTIDYGYAISYAGYNGTMIYGLLDEKNSKYMTYNQVFRIRNGLDQSLIEDNVTNHLTKMGLDSDRAKRIGKSFAQAVKNDNGLVAILMGLDFYISDNHQRNLFNLNKWIIKEV